MIEANPIAVALYLPGDPKSLLEYLENHLSGPNKDVLVLLWVDNNDHKTSAEFYTLRKLIRKGLKLRMFINPPLPSASEVFDFLAAQVTAHDKDQTTNLPGI